MEGKFEGGFEKDEDLEFTPEFESFKEGDIVKHKEDEWEGRIVSMKVGPNSTKEIHVQIGDRKDNVAVVSPEELRVIKREE